MASKKWPNKDPDEELDYKVDWSVAIGTDNIVNSIWLVPAGLVKESDSFTNKATTIWLSGGVLGIIYYVTNRIVTNGGRTFDQTVKLKCRAK